MIVTSWEEAHEAIVEQRGERLAADIEALLRERELLAEEKTMTSAEIEAEVRRRLQEQEGRIKELEAECMAHHNRTAMVALGTEHFDHGERDRRPDQGQRPSLNGWPCSSSTERANRANSS